MNLRKWVSMTLVLQMTLINIPYSTFAGPRDPSSVQLSKAVNDYQVLLHFLNEKNENSPIDIEEALRQLDEQDLNIEEIRPLFTLLKTILLNQDLELNSKLSEKIKGNEKYLMIQEEAECTNFSQMMDPKTGIPYLHQIIDLCIKHLAEFQSFAF